MRCGIIPVPGIMYFPIFWSCKSLESHRWLSGAVVISQIFDVQQLCPLQMMHQESSGNMLDSPYAGGSDWSQAMQPPPRRELSLSRMHQNGSHHSSQHHSQVTPHSLLDGMNGGAYNASSRTIIAPRKYTHLLYYMLYCVWDGPALLFSVYTATPWYHACQYTAM